MGIDAEEGTQAASDGDGDEASVEEELQRHVDTVNAKKSDRDRKEGKFGARGRGTAITRHGYQAIGIGRTVTGTGLAAGTLSH